MSVGFPRRDAVRVMLIGDSKLEPSCSLYRILVKGGTTSDASSKDRVAAKLFALSFICSAR